MLRAGQRRARHRRHRRDPRELDRQHRRHRARGRRDHRRHRLPRHRLPDLRAHHRARTAARWPRSGREHGQQAYKGATVAGFPNLLFLVGPNTGLGHSSMVYMIESQLNYLPSALADDGPRTISRRSRCARTRSATTTPSCRSAWSSTIWTTGGCASWYLDAHGNNTTLWPELHLRVPAAHPSLRPATRTARPLARPPTAPRHRVARKELA